MESKLSAGLQLVFTLETIDSVINGIRR